MAASVKRSRQGLLLLALLLLALSVIPAQISGESIDGKSKTSIGANKAIVHDDKFNGCSYNQAPHDESAVFCCNKDNLCWPSLPECVPNCPCKVNC